MCGRFYFEAGDPFINAVIDRLIAKYPGATISAGEIFPSDKIPAVTAENGRISAEFVRWGYSRQDRKSGIINARAESATQKALFASDFYHRRCLLPATGFYEWSSDKKKYLFSRIDGKALYLGALFRIYHGIKECVILTKEATYPVNEIHGRIPVILDEKNVRPWLGSADFAADYVTKGFLPELKMLEL